jgi:hypothetical protein
MTDRTQKLVWLGISGVAAVAGHQLARRSLDSGWKVVTGSEPPNQGELQDDLKQALTWGALSGTIVAMARILARRGAEGGWRRVVGSDPPTG